ncbi:LysM peptidoglycan-binding domain-containing protein [candidate division KSB1 bacterium]|nr:LysM peptidoglycan-binding domain-containing protein [candidate division KSB1 bacterium]
MKRISIFIFLVAAMTVSHLFGGIKDKLGLGLNINAHKLYGDTRSGSLGLGGGNLLLRYRLKPALFLEFELGFLRLSTQANGTSLHTDMLNLGAKAGYTFLTSQIYQPYVYFGIGALNFGKFKYLFEVSPLASFSFWDGYVALGAGTEFFASDFLAVNVTADFRYTSGDGFDGGFDGSRKDGYLNLGLGFIYHFDRHSNQGEPYMTVPEFDPFYFEVAKANVEEEIEGIVESTDQELNMQTLLSLMEEEQAPKVEENAMTLEDDILPEPETTRETVVHRGAEIESWVYTVQPNDWLSKIAAIFYGDPMAYAKIVEDNPIVIENPDQIEAGQKLLIMIAKGMPVSYTVKEGESLSRIANRFYGDPMKFKDIFLANQDTIEDPDIIRPGQVLKIFLTEN